MGFFKRKKNSGRNVKSNRTRKNSGPKSKSLRKKLVSIFNSKRKNSNDTDDSSPPDNHVVTIISPGEATSGTLGSCASNTTPPAALKRDLSQGYEIVLENDKQNLVSPLPEQQKQELNNHQLNFCGYDDSMKEITHVECSPMDDWNKFFSFLMVPDVTGIKNYVFGEDENSHNPPVDVVQNLSSSPIPFDERAEDPTFHDEQRQLNSLLDGQDDETLLSSQPSQDNMDRLNPASPARSTTVASVSSVSVASVSSTLPNNLTTPPTIRRHEVLVEEPLPEKGTSAASPSDFPSVQPPPEQIYDTAFTLRFLREITQVGIMLEYFKVNGTEENMKSTLVSLVVRPGMTRGSRLLEPRLFWKEMNLPHGHKDEGISISLLGIDSIHTSLSQNDVKEDDSPFFTITNETGDIHAFEAPTISERNYVVHGIKNVVAWLSYHLIMGNMASGSEIVSDLEEFDEESGNLPSLKTPIRAMNDLAHSFLD